MSTVAALRESSRTSLCHGLRPILNQIVREDVVPLYEELMKHTVMEVLGCHIEELTADRVVVSMPVTDAARQPFGLLHGGVSVVLAESCASMGTWLNIDQAAEAAVGIEINANHVRAVREGTITAVATPLHRGRTTFAWDVRITDDRDRLVCVSRCTVAVVRQQPESSPPRD